MADGSRPCVERATGRTTHRSIPQLEAIRLPLEVAEGETLGAHRATALENAVAYVRCTTYDVRFINNVRVAQILFGSLTYAEIPLDPSL